MIYKAKKFGVSFVQERFVSDLLKLIQQFSMEFDIAVYRALRRMLILDQKWTLEHVIETAVASLGATLPPPPIDISESKSAILHRAARKKSVPHRESGKAKETTQHFHCDSVESTPELSAPKTLHTENPPQF